MKKLIERLTRQKRRELTSYVSSQLDVSFESSERNALLDRLSSQYQIAFKESNRYFTIYLLASLFYVFKLAGLRFDILLVGQKVYDSNYGIFLFSSTGLIFLTIAALRAADAAVLEQIVGAVCEQTCGKSADLYTKSYVSGGVWMHTLIEIAPSVEGRKTFFALNVLQWLTWGVLVFSVAIAPIVIGIYVMIDHQNQIIGEHQSLQFYVVLVLTVTAIISGMYALSAQELDKLQ
jgi:hypothetical protein